jgi:pimeloyl-ACP methyl ester carboxylesterase
MTIDGDSADWGDGGLHVDVLSSALPRPDPANLDATLRVAWSDQGLLVLVSVVDDRIVEEEMDDNLWRKDCVELFLADAWGGESGFQVVIAPGLDGKHDKPRVKFFDQRAEALRQVKLAAQVGVARSASGYVLEALLPWENLGIVPQLGREVAFQAQVSDVDVQERSQLMWFPVAGAYSDRKLMVPLVLGATGGSDAAIRFAASGEYERFRRVLVNVTARGDLAGKGVRLSRGRAEAMAALTASGDLAAAALSLPLAQPDAAPEPLIVTVEGQSPQPVLLPDLAAARKAEFERQEIAFRPFVFSSSQLPKADYRNPSLVEDLVGRYTIETSYYDADYKQVTSADKPGRYGAIVRVTLASGPQPPPKFFTLYRAPQETPWRKLSLGPASMPAEFGVRPEVLKNASRELAEFYKWELRDMTDSSGSLATLLAGLAEMAPGESVTERTGPWARDARWWTGLKKRLGLLEPYKYIVHVPAGASPGQKLPALLFLHGAGERGNDTKRLLTHGPLKMAAAAEARGENWPMLIIAPQCPAQSWWQPELLKELVTEVLAKYPIDPERFYLSGLSMGGFGSWRLACDMPETFAAVAPICGGGDDRDVERIKDLPIWVFHGGKDPTVPVELSYDMVKALRAVSGRVRFTLYPDAGHDSWTAAYNSPELWSWMLAQRRGKPAQPPASMPGTAPSE